MLNRQEILRYIGASENSKTLEAMIHRAETEVMNAATPRHVFKHTHIDVDIDSGFVSISGTTITSRDLAHHLYGCDESFLFACTLGPGIDTLVKRYSITDIAMLPVIQAVAATYTETYADQAEEEIEIYARNHNRYVRPRYSPGYGDFPLSSQHFLFNALEITKKIGVCLTDSFLMVPFKSVTAVIGLSQDPSLCHIHRCMSCSANNCPFRKEIESQ